MRAKTFVVAWIWLGLLGCAASEGAPQTATAAPGPSAGSETAAVPESEAEVAPDPEPAQVPPSGPSSLTVSASVKGANVAAHVRLLRADGSAAAEGDAGQKLTVPSGDYSLDVQVTDESVLVDRPNKRSEVTLAPGGDLSQSVSFPWARIKLNVQVNGKLDPSAVVRILRQGAIVAEIRSGGDYVNVSPGRYKAVVKTRGAEIEVDQIMFPEGATREMPVPVQM